jgi:hypothetical protein
MADVLEGSGRLDHTYTDPDDQSGGPTRRWHATRPDFKAKVACADCNNGWMSDLEKAAKRRVPPLVHGLPSSLSRVDCAVLARWAAKTALMFQASERSEDGVVAPEFFAALRDAGNPGGLPPTLRVWIGAVDAHGGWSHAFAGTLGPSGTATAGPPFFAVLLAFDRLTFMVTGCEDASVLARVGLGHLGKAWTEISRRPNGMQWPPQFTFPAAQFPAMPALLPELASVRAR